LARSQKSLSRCSENWKLHCYRGGPEADPALRRLCETFWPLPLSCQMATMHMKPEELERLKRQAAQLVIRRAKELVQEGKGNRPPISPERLAPLCSVQRIDRDALGAVAGLLVPMKDGFIMKINSSHSAQRQRFTCAHELAHTFLFEEESKRICRELALTLGAVKYRSFEETLCHLGAAEILMPFLMFRSEASKYGFSISGLAPLARLFDTSVQASALRIGQVSPKPCQVLMWQQQADSASGELRAKLKWVSASPMRTQGDTAFLATSIIGSKTSSILQAFRQDEPVFSEEHLQLPNLKGFCKLESQGFLSGKYRYVITLAFPQESF